MAGGNGDFERATRHLQEARSAHAETHAQLAKAQAELKALELALDPKRAEIETLKQRLRNAAGAVREKADAVTAALGGIKAGVAGPGGYVEALRARLSKDKRYAVRLVCKSGELDEALTFEIGFPLHIKAGVRFEPYALSEWPWDETKIRDVTVEQVQLFEVGSSTIDMTCEPKDLLWPTALYYNRMPCVLPAFTVQVQP